MQAGYIAIPPQCLKKYTPMFEPGFLPLINGNSFRHPPPPPMSAFPQEKISHYTTADDTTLYCNLDDTTSDILLNNELTKITDWLSSNKLSLNVKKTKFMVFHTPQRRVNYPTLKLNNVNIERVSQFNFLGAILASSLKWDKHVAHVSLKISRVIGVLYRLKHIFPREVLLTLCNALILPHLSYYTIICGCQ